jgi:hypothetical protein
VPQRETAGDSFIQRVCFGNHPRFGLRYEPGLRGADRSRRYGSALRARGAKSSLAAGHSQGTQRSTVRRAGIPSDSVRLQNDTLVTVREHLNELCGDLGLIHGLAGGCGWELFEQSHPTGVQLYTKDTEGHDNAIAFK